MRLIYSTIVTALLLTPINTRAIEINGQTSFVEVPTKVKLTNYKWYAFESGAKYYFTLELPKGADASLGGINLQQIQGVQSAFYRGPVQPQAFYGSPRRSGQSIPVSASFKNNARSINISFAEPVSPGSKITVIFNVRRNPPAGLYLYSVSARPWGTKPISQDVGVARMSIHSVNRR